MTDSTTKLVGETAAHAYLERKLGRGAVLKWTTDEQGDCLIQSFSSDAPQHGGPQRARDIQIIAEVCSAAANTSGVTAEQTFAYLFQQRTGNTGDATK